MPHYLPAAWIKLNDAFRRFQPEETLSVFQDFAGDADLIMLGFGQVNDLLVGLIPKFQPGTVRGQPGVSILVKKDVMDAEFLGKMLKRSCFRIMPIKTPLVDAEPESVLVVLFKGHQPAHAPEVFHLVGIAPECTFFNIGQHAQARFALKTGYPYALIPRDKHLAKIALR